MTSKSIMKAKLMIISRNPPENPIIYVDDEPRKPLKTFKYLGTTINDQCDP